jgi:hypothetical protein
MKSATSAALKEGRVRCPACGKEQEDRGRGKTCERCGVSPLPSAAYPHGHSMHWTGYMTPALLAGVRNLNRG